jgi:hypothetical protein
VPRGEVLAGATRLNIKSFMTVIGNPLKILIASIYGHRLQRATFNSGCGDFRPPMFRRGFQAVKIGCHRSFFSVSLDNETPKGASKVL